MDKRPASGSMVYHTQYGIANYTNGYDHIDVDVLDVKLNIAKMFWNAYRMTWIELQNRPYNSKDPAVIKACRDVANNRALPTPKESVEIMFRINNISRVCLAQITRGRIGWWFNVESQMPQAVDHMALVPINILSNPKLVDKARDLVALSQRFYDDCLDAGIPPQDARYMLMHGQTCSMVATCNINSLIGFFAMRTENGLADEINLVARLMKLQLRNHIVKAYADGEIDDLDMEIWNSFFPKMDCLGAGQKVCMNYDEVFGNTGRFPSANADIPTPATAFPPNYDFKKSAWYLELKKLPEDLLLPGEKEMIEGWNKEGQ